MRMTSEFARGHGWPSEKNSPPSKYCSSGDVQLAVYCQGDPSKPNIVLVHGYPDDSRVWNPLVDQLADQFYVIRYDVRGAGNSTAPMSKSGYSLSYLQADLEAISTKFCTRSHFHLVGHDWGSVQSWESVTCPTFQEKILSYTSISGPCLDHVGQWFRRCLSEPGGSLPLVKQVIRSWYIWFFQLPFLAPILWQLLLARHWNRLLRLLEGINSQGATFDEADKRQRNGINGIELYRANCWRYFRAPRQRRSEVPIQLVIPSRDRFLGAELYMETPNWVSSITTRSVEGGHWLPLSHPQELAALIADFALRAKC